jgi:branched-chain amino acid transport system ATP-binding protein
MILEARNLSKSFGGVRAVANVSFGVGAGELLAMIGPNGAGKTTCFNLINGQLTPDTGAVVLQGEEIQALAPRRRFRLGVGRTFQVAETFGSLTVRENVQMALMSREGRLRSMSPGLEKESEADGFLEQVGMRDQGARPCALLAYGDLKRVELAVALAGRPRVLLMDEPTAGMAPEERSALMRLAAELARSQGIAVLFTEHDMDVVFGHADRVIVLSDGELIAQGSPADVRADRRVREIYLGDADA